MTTNPCQPPTADEPRDGPAVRMTATAWKRGAVNALICVVSVLGTWWLVRWLISSVTGWSPLVVGGIAFGGLFIAALFCMILTLLHGLQNRGVQLLDCGGHPGRRLFLVNAGIFLLLGTFGTMFTDAFGRFGAVFGVSFAVYWLFMGTSRLSVHENGIWVYTGLIRWEKIMSYSWNADKTLVYSCSGRIPFLSRGALPVSAEYFIEFQQLLDQHAPHATT